MDLFNSICSEGSHAIKTIDMHTTGEPTRIVYAGFPDLQGTLLEQREQAHTSYDHLRKRIMLEPRGHFDMYGAIIRRDTELVESGDADIGVLFTHNGGFSTMCGHATIALGRFLVDTTDECVFPGRRKLTFDATTCTAQVRLHAPCGVVTITVPTTSDGRKSDPSRPVSFLSTPAYAAATDVQIDIPAHIRWEELGTRKSIKFDISYGGAFYALVTARELGFANGLQAVDIDQITACIRRLKPFLTSHPRVKNALDHPEGSSMSFLYSVMVVDENIGYRPQEIEGVETGLCYFADNEIDRSPTGSCVSARMALRYHKGLIAPGEKRAYNSLISNHFAEGAFIARIASVCPDTSVIVQVQGFAYYTGTSAFVWEEGDKTSQEGFVFGKCV
ncbi:LADA_0C07404g1_1 [Lachancea dasiensis]|uniref:trans-L-3-hydroxyproline dehydratase n=1 Tax=Lachancea dasiensis TaxID=1072105 RepID=A0A1G4IZQ0_9SACH|nr:LADA_0C07404g1_1 [Lachancea dasiensis]